MHLLASNPKQLLGVYCCIVAVLLILVFNAVSASASELYVDRNTKKIYVLDGRHHIVLLDSVGIGKGGLKAKVNMDDLVTPTGTFTVDLILFKDKRFNQISAALKNRYQASKKFKCLVNSQDALSVLFSNMNRLDFDNDGKADHSYGDGYIGINSDENVTGPKMQFFRSTPYWYSIALHGTTHPESIGRAESGGCVHLSEKTLSKLIRDGLVAIGTQVTISDKPP
jgi:hypothetical protein